MRPSLAQVRPDILRRKPARPSMRVGKIMRDVENLAEVAVDTVEQLDARGLPELARPLEDAIVRLAGKRMPD